MWVSNSVFLILIYLEDDCKTDKIKTLQKLSENCAQEKLPKAHVSKSSYENVLEENRKQREFLSPRAFQFSLSRTCKKQLGKISDGKLL